MIHHIRKHESRSYDQAYTAVTLPDVPGVTMDTARSDTAPTLPTIRAPKHPRRHAGVALQAAAARRVQWVREALMEVGG